MMMLGLPRDCEAEAWTVTLPGPELLTTIVHWPAALVVAVVQVPPVIEPTLPATVFELTVTPVFGDQAVAVTEILLDGDGERVCGADLVRRVPADRDLRVNDRERLAGADGGVGVVRIGAGDVLGVERVGTGRERPMRRGLHPRAGLGAVRRRRRAVAGREELERDRAGERGRAPAGVVTVAVS